MGRARYLFILNYLKNIRKIELTIVDKIMLFIVLPCSTCTHPLGDSRAPGIGFKKVIIGTGAVLVDYAGKAMEMAVNDPHFLRDYGNSLHMMWAKDSEGNINNQEVTVEIPKDKLDKILTESSSSSYSSNTTSFLPADGIQSYILSYMKEIFYPIIMLLKPQLVNYPIEDLMLQHHLISMVLFFIVTAIFFFFIIFLYNILLISYRNKIMNYFKNKYILIYLNFQFKIIKLETMFLIILIFYCFYYLFYGLHFLAVFPIDFNIQPTGPK